MTLTVLVSVAVYVTVLLPQVSVQVVVQTAVELTGEAGVLELDEPVTILCKLLAR